MIDEKALREAFGALQARVAYLERATGLFVPDSELDKPKGNPKVKFAPRDWRGPDPIGKLFSECAPAFLEMLAEALSWAADNPKEGKEKYAAYNRLDAARARSWARRLRASGTAPAPAPAASSNGARPNGARPTYQQPTKSSPSDDLFGED